MLAAWARWVGTGELVGAGEVGLGFVGQVDAVGDLGGVGLVGELGVDAHPPSGGTLEGDDFRVDVALEQVGFLLLGVDLGGEGAYLDAPTTTGGHVWRERRCVKGFDADLDDAGTVDSGALGCGKREVDDAAADKGAAVGDTNDDAFAVGEIGDADDGTEWESKVSGGHGVLVVDGAVRAFAASVRWTVPAGEADGGVEGLAMEQCRAGGRRVAGGAGSARCAVWGVSDDGGVRVVGDLGVGVPGVAGGGLRSGGRRRGCGGGLRAVMAAGGEEQKGRDGGQEMVRADAGNLVHRSGVFGWAGLAGRVWAGSWL